VAVGRGGRGDSERRGGSRRGDDGRGDGGRRDGGRRRCVVDYHSRKFRSRESGGVHVHGVVWCAVENGGRKDGRCVVDNGGRKDRRGRVLRSRHQPGWVLHRDIVDVLHHDIVDVDHLDVGALLRDERVGAGTDGDLADTERLYRDRPRHKAAIVGLIDIVHELANVLVHSSQIYRQRHGRRLANRLHAVRCLCRHWRIAICVDELV